MKTGIVLEGGGFRGIYTAGVLDIFMEHGLTFDGLIGVSAGAVHGCSFLSGQKGRSINYYTKYCNDPRFMSFTSWLKTGDLVGVDFSYRELPMNLVPYDNDAFLRNTTPFYVVCTDLDSGKAEYVKINDMFKDIDYLRASATLPYFSHIVDINGKKYLDGGCADAIPLKAFQKMGYEKNIVVLTRPSGYIKKPEIRLTAKLLYRKYPNFVATMRDRAENYNKTVKYIEQCEREGSAFVIRPESKLPAGRLEHDPEKIRATYDAGANDAKKTIEKLLNWLEH